MNHPLRNRQNVYTANARVFYSPAALYGCVPYLARRSNVSKPPGFHQSADVAPVYQLTQPIETYNGYFGNVLLVPAGTSWGIYLYESTDRGQTWGVNNAAAPVAPNNGGAVDLQTYCSGNYQNGCGYGFGNEDFLGYITFSDINYHLSVWQITSPSNDNYYTAIQVFEDTSVRLTSAPCMLTTPSGTLLTRYGTSNSSTLKNATYVTEGVPPAGSKGSPNLTFSTHSTTGLPPTQCAMVNFNNAIYAFDGQDNSDGGVFVSQLDGNGNTLANTPAQINGITTQSGLSAVVFNGIINLSFRDSSNHFNIAASGNGST